MSLLKGTVYLYLLHFLDFISGEYLESTVRGVEKVPEMGCWERQTRAFLEILFQLIRKYPWHNYLLRDEESEKIIPKCGYEKVVWSWVNTDRISL